MTAILQILIDALSLGSLYALGALGNKGPIVVRCFFDGIFWICPDPMNAVLVGEVQIRSRKHRKKLTAGNEHVLQMNGVVAGHSVRTTVRGRADRGDSARV